MKQTDTIAAIATAASNSGIGVIRISGTESITVADKCFVSKNDNFKIKDAKANTIHYGFIANGDNIIDEVLVFVFRAPHSFTAEDTVEISCHGGSFVIKKILNVILTCGARLAEPGEFTKRAFLNGRIDLSKAEAVMDIINSENDFVLSNSVNQLRGSLYNEINDLRNIILHETAFIEAAMDDPDSYSLDDYSDKISNILLKLIDRITNILKTSDDGIILKEGIKTVILGRPNAGKSSLLNLLSGYKRAIVTDIAGTTRDILIEDIIIDGVNLKIYDTAGIRDTDNQIEKIGVDLALDAANDADLILYVIDSVEGCSDLDLEILDKIKSKKVIILWNKEDLVANTNKKINYDFININFSTKESTGLDELKDTILSLFDNNKIKYNSDICITNIRHKELFTSALSSLKLVLDAVNNGVSEDLYSIDLYDAYASLGLIIGEQVSEDLVDKIFSDFCMGK